MKLLLPKLLAREGSGKSVFFTFTLWIVGMYFVASCLLSFEQLSWPRYFGFEYDLLSLSIVLTLGFAAEFGYFYYRKSKPRRWLRWLFWPTVILSVAITVWAISADSGYFLLAVPGFFIFWFLMLRLLSHVRWYYVLVNVLCWAGSLLIALSTMVIGASPYRCDEKLGAHNSDGFWYLYPGYYDRSFYYDIKGEAPVNWLWTIPQFFHFSGNDWLWFMSLGVALFAAGYLLLAKIFADTETIPWRRMFGKGVFILWGLAAVIYLTFAVWSFVINQRTAENVRCLEQRFGRPVTIAALGQQYYNGDQPDMDFWRKLTEISEKDLAINKKVKFNENPLVELTPEQLTLCRQKFALIAPGLTQWEQAFTARNPAPPWERQYLPGKEYEIVFYPAKLVSWFGFDETWQLRLALEDHNLDLAFQAWERINTVNDILLRENNWPSISIWIICQNRQLDALQRLLEPDRLSGAQLETISTRLSQIESQVPVMHERSIYGRTVAEWDYYDRIGHGYRERADLPSVPPLYYIKWILPQLGTFFATEKYKAMRDFVKQYITPPGDAKNHEYYYKQYDELTARIRAAQSVIRTIEYKQKHGHYPETLDDLPLDPFTGKPMHYHFGEWQIAQRYLKIPDDDWENQWQIKTVPAVISWSVGQNLKDDQNKSYSYNSDDIAFVVRIKP